MPSVCVYKWINRSNHAQCHVNVILCHAMLYRTAKCLNPELRTLLDDRIVFRFRQPPWNSRIAVKFFGILFLIHVQNSRNLLQPREFFSISSEIRLSGKVVGDCSDIPFISNGSELIRLYRKTTLARGLLISLWRAAPSLNQSCWDNQPTSVNLIPMIIFSQGRTKISTVILKKL